MRDCWVSRGAAVLFGGALGVFCPNDFRVWFGAVLLWFGLRLWWWRPRDFAGQWYRPEFLLTAVSLAVGFLVGLGGDRMLPPPLLIEDTIIEGVMREWRLEADGSGRGIIRWSGPEGQAAYVLRVYPVSSAEDGPQLPAGWKEVRPGNSIRFSGKIEQPESARNAGAFDIRHYYATHGLAGRVTARSEAVLLDAGRAPVSSRVHSAVREVVTAFWPQEAPILEGLLFGDSSRLPEEVLERYKITGVLHAFAASGMNMGFTVALIWILTFPCPRILRIGLSLMGILFYTNLCGNSVSIVRAAILAGAALLGSLGRGRVDSLRWLIWAGVALFFWNPLFLGDVSFLLSFAAAWGLVVLAPRLTQGRLWRCWPRLLRQTLSFTLAAQLAVTPILASTFYRVSLIGLLANVLLAGLLGAVVQLGLLGAGLLVVALPLALPFFQVAVWMLKAMDGLLIFLAGWRWADLWVVEPGFLFWTAWYALLAAVLCGGDAVFFWAESMRRRGIWALKRWRIPLPERWLAPRLTSEMRRSPLLPLGLALVLLLVTLAAPGVGRARLEIVFLDVGQGDCILVRTASETLMVDTGPRSETYDSGERVIVPYLLGHRVRKIDLLSLTHPDTDHIGGARYILTHVQVDKIAVPSHGRDLNAEAWRDGLPFDFWPAGEMVMPLAAGDVLSWPSGLQIEVLAPVAPLAGANNNSLVLCLTYGRWSLLLTGDMEQEEMQAMVDRGADWNATFIKIPHHGSRGSMRADWFDRTTPLAVFIPVGRNMYGHPTNEVLDYWKGRGIPVYRTDQEGTIRLLLDARQAEIDCR